MFTKEILSKIFFVLSLSVVLYSQTKNPDDFTSSNLPIIVIDTDAQTIVHEPKIMATMGIVNNGAGNRNSVTDPFNEYDGWIGIEYRGNASFGVSDKKPFTIETRNEDGSNNNVEILGLPKENDFVLRAVYIDKTLMRDALAYYMYRSMGRWAPRTRHVEVVLNGDYQGVYVLEEKIKPDKNRLAIAKMDSADISGEALTGGYIWCTNRRWADYEHNDLLFDETEADGNPRFLRYPKPSDVMPEQLAYISQFEQDFGDIMKGPNYNVPFIGYDKYIDLQSFIDEIILQEVTSNSDAYSYSGYFFKDRGKKINAGPAWDFDQALCNSTHNDGSRFDEWNIQKRDDGRPPFWDRLFADDEIQEQLKTRWNSLRNDALHTDRIIAFIDSVVNYLSEAQGHNFEKWPILGVTIWRSLPGAEQRDTYQKEVDYMKTWLLNHLDWMDEKLYQGDQTITEFKLHTNYPNPFNPTTKIFYEIPETTNVLLQIYNITGQEIKTLINDRKDAGVYSVSWDGTNNNGYRVSSGIYVYTLTARNRFEDSKKMILVR